MNVLIRMSDSIKMAGKRQNQPTSILNLTLRLSTIAFISPQNINL